MLIAFIITAVYGAGIFIFHLTGVTNLYPKDLIVGGFLFLVTFFAVRYFFRRFVEKKINPIFKTIHDITLSQKELRRKIDSEDIATDLDREVKVWARNQTEEIKKLKQMEKYRKDFLGNVSHEMKTPIFNVQGYVLTLLDGGMDDPQINKLYLERTERSINRLISIVDDLESISRLESGEFKLHIEKFNIIKLVEDIFEAQDMNQKKYGIKLGFDSNYSKPIWVNADKRRITEVLGNLIGNSIKYGKKNGKTTVSFVDTGDSILVDVSDNGIGVAEEDLPRIFERFYRVDKSRSRDSGGTGLGLSIVKHIIQAHNQTINVRSKLGKGTSFIFSLEKA